MKMRDKRGRGGARVGLPFILTEGEGAVLTERVIAMVRCDGRTTIMADGEHGSSSFTPLALARRSARFWREHTWSRTSLTR